MVLLIAFLYVAVLLLRHQRLLWTASPPFLPNMVEGRPFLRPLELPFRRPFSFVRGHRTKGLVYAPLLQRRSFRSAAALACRSISSSSALTPPVRMHTMLWIITFDVPAMAMAPPPSGVVRKKRGSMSNTARALTQQGEKRWYATIHRCPRAQSRVFGPHRVTGLSEIVCSSVAVERGTTRPPSASRP